MKIIFDFDDVIFKAGEFKEVMFQIIALYTEEPLEVIKNKYLEVRTYGTPFSLRKFLVLVAPDVSESKREEFYQNVLSESKYLVNQNVISVMKGLGKEHCYIVTHGDETFQKDKIRESQVKDLVQEVIVVSGMKSEAIVSLCEKYHGEEIIFVDDKVAFLHDIPKERCPNLRTVLFDTHGLENLNREIKRSRIAEPQKVAPEMPVFA